MTCPPERTKPLCASAQNALIINKAKIFSCKLPATRFLYQEGRTLNDVRGLAEVTPPPLCSITKQLNSRDLRKELSKSDSLNRMALDLETLRKEVEAQLNKFGMPVFHGHHRMVDSLIQVAWDTERHPDFREFLEAARKAGAKLIVYNYDSFRLDQIDEALEELEESDFSREEKRNYESRLRQLQAYEGFTCSLQISFSLEGHLYLFELLTDWYQALNGILTELDLAAGGFGDEEEEGPMGGSYFSKN